MAENNKEKQDMIDELNEKFKHEVNKFILKAEFEKLYQELIKSNEKED